ncbi:MAG: ECF transporter S component [Clostridiales bacterium]|nr:ECF transporter S component [Clostridiales bacterium]
MSEITKDSTMSVRRAIIRKIACTAVMTALAVTLMYVEVSLPFMPPFLKFDFSEIPVLVGSFALGPIYGIIIELLKNLLHLPATGTMGIGELSNFITGSIYVFTAGMIYSKHRTRKGAIISMIVATLLLGLIACPFNYFITLPLYESVLHVPMEAILGMCSYNPLIKEKIDLITYVFLPFNLFKGTVVAIITFFIYKPISRLINKTYKETRE